MKTISEELKYSPSLRFSTTERIIDGMSCYLWSYSNDKEDAKKDLNYIRKEHGAPRIARMTTIRDLSGKPAYLVWSCRKQH